MIGRDLTYYAEVPVIPLTPPWEVYGHHEKMHKHGLFCEGLGCREATQAEIAERAHELIQALPKEKQEDFGWKYVWHCPHCGQIERGWSLVNEKRECNQCGREAI